MRLRKKPLKPKRIFKQYVINVSNGDSLAQIIEEAFKKGFQLDKLIYHERWDRFIGTKEESDEEFNEKMLKFEEEMNRYNKWFDKNKIAIEEEIKKRSDRKQKQEERRTKRLATTLQREKDRIEKRLEKLQGTK